MIADALTDGSGSDAIYAAIVLVLVVVIAVGAWLDD